MKLFLSLALFAAFLLCPAACADGVREGLSLAAVQALPALFPFFVVSGLLVRCDTARLSPLLAKPQEKPLWSASPCGEGKMRYEGGATC